MLNTSRSLLYSFEKSVRSISLSTLFIKSWATSMLCEPDSSSLLPSVSVTRSSKCERYPFTTYRHATKLPLSQVEIKKLGSAFNVPIWYQLKRCPFHFSSFMMVPITCFSRFTALLCEMNPSSAALIMAVIENPMLVGEVL